MAKIRVAVSAIALLSTLGLLVSGCGSTAQSQNKTDSGSTVQPAEDVDVADLNSDARDFEVTFSKDGKTAVFSSNRAGGHGGNDVYTSTLENGKWSKPVNAGTGVNTSVDEQEPTFSDDGNLLYFTRYTSQINGDLYVSEKVNGQWQKAKNWNDVPELPSLNSSKSEEHCPIIVSKDLIYFSHDAPGVTKKSDVWQVKRVNGKWQKPEPLPGEINSAYRDHIHWSGLSADGNSLIVVSARPDGSHGGSDEWISHRGADGQWGKPVNLGSKVNTAGDEECWTFTSDGKYFVGESTKKGSVGGSDFYAVPKDQIPELKSFQPRSTAQINLLKEA